MNKMETAESLRELADIIREVLPKIGWEDVAGMIPIKYCDVDSMPDDVEGLMAWDETGAIRCGLWASNDVAVYVPADKASATA